VEPEVRDDLGESPRAGRVRMLTDQLLNLGGAEPPVEGCYRRWLGIAAGAGAGCGILNSCWFRGCRKEACCCGAARGKRSAGRWQLQQRPGQSMPVGACGGAVVLGAVRFLVGWCIRPPFVVLKGGEAEQGEDLITGGGR